MTGCEIVVVLGLVVRDGVPAAIRARVHNPQHCAKVTLVATAPVRARYPLCPVIGR